MKIVKTLNEFISHKNGDFLIESKNEKAMLQAIDTASSIWLSATRKPGSEKNTLIKKAEEIMVNGLTKYMSTLNTATVQWDKIEDLKKVTGNPLVLNILNQNQNELRHSIKIENW